MVEEEVNEEKVEEEKSPSLISQAEEAAAKLKEQNDRQEELLNRQEELMSKQALGGQSEAGKIIAPQEETAQDYAKKVMSGDLGNG
jgi:vacuolar-type H+-ATPase subunit H|tara:strand:- start:350 stop:607 length:258 start_codon:yes stop_codon:yes gene_type:complete